MELADCNITFVHITGRRSVLADAISRIKKTLDIYKGKLENPKIPVFSKTKEHATEILATDMCNVSITMFCNEQKWDIMCTKTSITITLQ